MITVERQDLSPAKRALLEQRIRGGGRPPKSATPPVSRRQAEGPAPLSLAQEQLWYFSQLAPKNPVYNEAASIRKDGPLDLDSLRWAFNEIVRRHEIWRTTFAVQSGRPIQVVGPAVAFDLPLTDLSALPADEREHAATMLIAEEARRPYQLSDGPLIRPLLVRFTEDHHRLYLAMHHLVFDGVSLYRIVLPELIALYKAATEGQASPLPVPSLQYADYAAWELEWATSDEVLRRLAYWRGRLEHAPSLELPLDHSRPPRQRFRGHMEALHVPAELTKTLREVARGAGCTLFQLVCAAFSVLLHRYSGQEDVVFGTMADLRQRSELESMVGYCLTPLALRVDLSGDPTFLDVLLRTRDEVLGALANLVPLERVVREVQPKRDPSLNPIYQAMVVVEPPAMESDSAWSMHQMEVAIGNAVGHAKLDLHLELDERPEGHMSGRLIYNTDVFERATARRIAAHLQRLLEGIGVEPRTPVSELPLMTAPELHRQVVEWNATEAGYPDQASLHELIQAQVERTPSATAVQCAGETLTYRELDRRANRLAHSLRAAGVAGGDLVAICSSRSLQMLIGMLGILKAGAAYVPLDPLYPADRLTFMVDDSAARVVVTDGALPAGLSDRNVVEVRIADGEEGGLLDAPPEGRVAAEDLAYVIYTSGSTGKPKGVAITHRSVVNLICSMAREPGLSASDRVLAITTYSFDIAVVELWLPLVCGAQIELVPTEMTADGPGLARLCEEVRPTFIQATPATWRMLLESGWKGDPGLIALAGGEAVDRELADQLLDRCGKLWNVYGPTETTVWSTLGAIGRGERISIGRPLANTSVHILDRQRRPQPVGVAGEIFIGGHGVARGYLNRPELTAERFVPDPFRPGCVMYATGDLGRRLSDGRIEHLGRLDHQVKVRGYRIELGEVETALLRDPGVAAAVVLAVADRLGERQLVAYVVPVGEAAPDAVPALRALLRRTLPEFMVPSVFVKLPALPLTPNGKVDRRALPPPDAASHFAGEPYVAPRTAMEEQLATIWSQVLGVDRVGIDDDFFDLGGHSLMAVRLLAEVHRELGIQVPVAAFFQGASTIAGLIKAIGDNEAGRSRELLYSVQPNGSRPPLFFVHSHETSLLTLRHFTGPLGPDQPLMALLPERRDLRFDRTSSVGQMAAGLVTAIRRVQEHGPYYIAGHSFGGMLAYEIASQLRIAGEDVDWLGLLDVATPEDAGRWRDFRLSRWARLKRLHKLGLRGAPAKVMEVMRRDSTEILASIGKKLDPLGESQYDWEGAMALVWKYRPVGTNAPLELFAPVDPLMRSSSRYLGWEEVHRGSLAIHEVPGDHLSMLAEPQVEYLAELFAARLRAAQERCLAQAV